MAFYNTNKEHGSTLSKSREKAANQDAKILAFMKRKKSKDFTPYQVWESLGENILLTSIRRSINTLLNDGKIKDTGWLRRGGFGKVNRVYKFKRA